MREVPLKFLQKELLVVMGFAAGSGKIPWDRLVTGGLLKSYEVFNGILFAEI